MHSSEQIIESIINNHKIDLNNPDIVKDLFREFSTGENAILTNEEIDWVFDFQNQDKLKKELCELQKREYENLSDEQKEWMDKYRFERSKAKKDKQTIQNEPPEDVVDFMDISPNKIRAIDFLAFKKFLEFCDKKDKIDTKKKLDKWIDFFNKYRESYNGVDKTVHQMPEIINHLGQEITKKDFINKLKKISQSSFPDQDWLEEYINNKINGIVLKIEFPFSPKEPIQYRHETKK
jgi:hypothetical protein